ncbi:MAG: hypothetical protein EXX96DRAFT_505695 [Benjaminiella poitrasii]|nr:MAG: hypothetical protein EXX96DRAFT_505695 [Benjaminiella poitrasii]
MSRSKEIGTLGSIALLVSSITVKKNYTYVQIQGPGLSTIPTLFQQSGWVLPTCAFISVAVLSCLSALYICEVLSNIHGNERFQAKIEFTTIAQVYLGTKYHYVFQIILFLSLQSANVASIIIAAQTFDSMFITIFKRTCGLALSHTGWICISKDIGNGNSPFPSDSFFLFTFGLLFTAFLVMPFGFFSLADNVIIQVISFIALTAILLQWVIAFIQEGLDTALLPAFGNDYSAILGIAIFNYSFITTIPSWINNMSPTVNIHHCLFISIVISIVFYLIFGISGAMAYKMDASSDILVILTTKGSLISKITSYLFPIFALITSIPVYTIVVRSNLIRGKICSSSWASFLSNCLPWIICIPIQTKDWIGALQNWSSLFFQSSVNYILPFVFYFISRKPSAPVKHNDIKLDESQHSVYPLICRQETAPPSPCFQTVNYNDISELLVSTKYMFSGEQSNIKTFGCNYNLENSLIYPPLNMNEKYNITTDSTHINNDSEKIVGFITQPCKFAKSSSQRSLTSDNNIDYEPSHFNNENITCRYGEKPNASIFSFEHCYSETTCRNPSTCHPTKVLEGLEPFSYNTEFNASSSSNALHCQCSSLISRDTLTLTPNKDDYEVTLNGEDSDNESAKLQQEIDDQVPKKFVALGKNCRINPFYLAITSCALLSLFIIYTIIYSFLKITIKK